VERYPEFSLEIEIWRIPRGAKAATDEAVNKGAEQNDTEELGDPLTVATEAVPRGYQP
jgi:hypothetical protein